MMWGHVIFLATNVDSAQDVKHPAPRFDEVTLPLRHSDSCCYQHPCMVFLEEK